MGMNGSILDLKEIFFNISNIIYNFSNDVNHEDIKIKYI